jgi:tRNA A-37 threonylcarbamoyl transferase component Bud32
VRSAPEPFAVAGFRGEVEPRFRPLDLAAAVRRLTDPGAADKTLHWGRNYIYRTTLDTAEGPVPVAVKQFRGGDARERLRRRRGEGKAARSWRAARGMAAAGLPTPEPVMLLESLDARGPSFYVCRAVEGAIEARYLFRAANAGEERERFPEVDFAGFLEELGREIRRLHDAGFWHRDVSAGNVLVRPGTPVELWLLDLNRARRRLRLTLSQRTRDLSRLPLFRPEHRALFLQAYWGAAPGVLARFLYLENFYAFRWKHAAKDRLRGVSRRVKTLLVPRGTHAHIPPPPAEAAVRDRVVWDHLSDQPHQHAGRLAKLGVRLADARAHLEEGAVVAAALPRIGRRYRALARELYARPVAWGGVGVALRPWPDDPEGLLAAVEELGVRHLLLRLHPWQDDHAAEEALARELAARGHELAFALPQNRELVRDPARWRAAVEELAARFTPYGRHFQVGQAINRSKWGIWSLGEYVELAVAAGEALRRYPGVEVLGPAVIDFEYHVTAAALNLRRTGLRFDAVSALLYVDRRGAPENAQAGFDTPRKLALLKAIADTSRNGTPRCWITEVNWPLREGPHAPAGRGVAVDEETQADYLARYYLLALASGMVERVYWWQLVAKGYGLVDPTALRRRPAFHALATLARSLEGCEFERRLPGPPGAWLLLFSRPDGGELVAAWSAAGPLAAELPRASGVSVTLGPSPTYYLLDRE